MIAPQPGQPGVIGQQHGLQRLTTALEALEKGQRAQATRDTQIQEQLTAQAARMAQMGRWLRYQLYALVGLGVLVLALGGAVGWQVLHPPEQVYARALGSIDAALVQTWSTLPKAAQGQLSTTYGRLGLIPPSQRK